MLQEQRLLPLYHLPEHFRFLLGCVISYARAL
jgi:hypothetical protein